MIAVLGFFGSIVIAILGCLAASKIYKRYGIDITGLAHFGDFDYPPTPQFLKQRQNRNNIK